jgi:hypothetical protein
MTITDLNPALLHALSALPLLAAYAVGLVLVLVHWRRRRRSAMLALLALGLLAAETAGVLLIYSLGLWDALTGPGWTVDQILLASSVIGFMASGLQAAALFLLLLALFTGRRRDE